MVMAALSYSTVNLLFVLRMEVRRDEFDRIVDYENERRISASNQRFTRVPQLASLLQKLPTILGATWVYLPLSGYIRGAWKSWFTAAEVSAVDFDLCPYSHQNTHASCGLKLNPRYVLSLSYGLALASQFLSAMMMMTKRTDGFYYVVRTTILSSNHLQRRS